MKFTSFLSLLPLAAFSSGYVVPSDLPDGFYEVTFDTEGNANTTRLSDLVTTPSVTGRGTKEVGPFPLSKRDSMGGTWKTFPDQADYNACTQGWRNALNNPSWFVGPWSVNVAKSGIAVLAGCNYRPTIARVPPQTVDQFNGIADANFGWWRTGWVYSDAYAWTFWRDFDGTDFCSNIRG